MIGNTVHINLKLGANVLSMDVPREQEAFYRQAQVTLNKSYETFRRSQPKASVDKLWMYTALECAVNLHNDMRQKSMEPVEERVKALNNLITQQLNN